MWGESELRALDGESEAESWGDTGESDEEGWTDTDDSGDSSGDEAGGDSAPAPGSPPRCRWCGQLTRRPFQENSQALVDTVVGRSGGSPHVRTTFPWGEESPLWDRQLPCWTCALDAAGKTRWWQGTSSTSRTLSHPSFQDFFASAASADAPSGLAGVGGHTSTSESKASTGWFPVLNCSSFYYTDPTMPPGFRIYNRLSGSSQEVCRRLRLNTPAPIMSVHEASAPRSLCASSRQLSDQEHRVVSPLLELPAGTPNTPGLATPPRCQQ